MSRVENLTPLYENIPSHSKNHSPSSKSNKQMSNIITRHIPNTLTCANLVSGCIAVYYALCGDAPTALLWIAAGAAFDFFDGMSARLLGVSSPIGKELDSLADDVTFGVAPSAIVFAQLNTMRFEGLPDSVVQYLPHVAWVMAAFSALRLAKFNLDTRQTTSFIGMPTPANALFWASLLVSHGGWIESVPYMAYCLAALLGVSCWLMVSEVPMFALKFKTWGWQGNETRYGFIAVAAAVTAWLGPTSALWMVVVLYLLVSLWHSRRR